MGIHWHQGKHAGVNCFETAWRRDLHQEPSHRSHITGSLLIVPERENHLVRLCPESGAVLWDARVQNTWGWLEVARDRCFWLNQHDRLQCISLHDGHLIWERSLRGRAGAIFGYLTCLGGVVVCGGWRGYSALTGLDALTGETVWTLAERGRHVAFPVASSRGLAVCVPDAGVVRFYEQSGTLVSELRTPEGLPQTDASRLFTKRGDDLIVAS